MNPATFASLPSDPCSAATESTTYGPDRISKTLYDNAGQVTQTIQAFGTSVQRAYATYAYSNNGKPTDSIDANGNRTKLIYDGFDRLKYYHYPSTTRPSAWNPSTQATALSTAGAYSTTDYEQYGYDNNGNKTSTRRRDGNTIGYSFDALNRETLKDIPGGTTKDVYTAYDLTGHIWSKRFNSASNTTGVFYYYDGLGRLESTTDTNSRTVWYQYNQAGSRTRLTYYDGNWQPYNLDAANRLTSTGIGIANLTLGYNDLGQMTTLSRNNSTSTSYGYDAIGRVSSMGQDFSSAGHDVSWTFVRNPSSQVRELTATNDADYTYDETATTTIGKSYDGLNRDATIAALSGGYDLRGNLTSEGVGGRTFTYDLENRLLTATGGSANLTLDYDPEGRLSSYTAGATTRTFLYDGVNLIGEYLGSTMDKRYLHGTGTDQPVVEFTGSDVGSTSVRSYLYTDYQGSVVATANSTGARVDVYKYDPYGRPTNGVNVETWTGTRFRYTGQTIISEARLYYYKARVYDPISGRFLQTDPIGSDDDLNLYAYTGGDPVNLTDSTGECPMCVGAAVGAGVDYGIQVAGNLASGQDLGDALTDVDMGSIAVSAALGSVGGIGGGQGLLTVAKGLNIVTKGRIGEGVARVGIALRGEKIIARGESAAKVAELGPLKGAAGRAKPDFVVTTRKGEVKVVEAKFGSAKLSGPQKALRAAIGEKNFRVARTSYDDVAKVGASGGGGAAGATCGGRSYAPCNTQ